jgi:CBS domain-containing protein
MKALSRIRLSRVVGRPVLGPAGETIGTVADVVVRLADGGLPTVTGGLLRLPSNEVFVGVKDVVAIDSSGVRLGSDKVDTRPFERRPGEVLLERDVRGRGVIDLERGRLVRVRDLVLGQDGERWQVVAVVASPPGSLATFLKRLLGREDELEEIPWRNIEPLVGHVPTAGQRLAFPRLARLKPAEIADIVEGASHDEGEQILDAVSQDEELEADVFEELDETHRVEFLKDRSHEEAAEVLSKMEPDHAADLLMQLPQERRGPILERLEPDQQRKVRSLLGYHPETAGGLMNNEFVALPAELTVEEALSRLRAMVEVPAVLTDVFVVEGDRLVGALRLSALVRADPKARLGNVAPPDPEAVFTDADLPSVAVQMADYNLSSLPVIDGEGRLVGIVTFDDLIEAMLPDQWRWRGRPDAARLPSHQTERARPA